MISVLDKLTALANPKQAKNLARFFKTGKGQYGEGDVFWGIKVPEIRKIVGEEYQNTDLATIKALLHDPHHEARLAGLLILVKKYQKTKDAAEKKLYFDLYLKNTKYINNWDLVDLSAPHIVGDYNFLYLKDIELFVKLAHSAMLWERRIAVLSCFHNIRQGEFQTAISICEIVLQDKHDLIHKAVGWMLREIGKRNMALLVDFLQRHQGSIPRTALRYAIEHFTVEEKRFFMQK